MSKEKFLDSLRDSITKVIDYLHTHHEDNIIDIILYGSLAKGQATVNSDIDVLMIYKDFDPDTMRKIRNDCRELSSLELDLHFLTEHAFSINNLYNVNVRKDGISLWKKI